MLYVKNTPNNLGVSIYGDCFDFDALYEAMQIIVGDEDEFPDYAASRTRVLGICYELRHALLGDREIEFVNNGLDQAKMKNMAIIAHAKNVYMKVNEFWPEILFVTMALNEFVKLYACKQANTSSQFLLNKRNIWDSSIAQIRIFQAALAKCMEESVTKTAFSRMLNLLNSEYICIDRYITQYIDVLNVRFIHMGKEQRLKKLPIIAKNLNEKDKEYREVEEVVLEAVEKYFCSVEEISLEGIDYPENFKW